MCRASAHPVHLEPWSLGAPGAPIRLDLPRPLQALGAAQMVNNAGLAAGALGRGLAGRWAAGGAEAPEEGPLPPPPQPLHPCHLQPGGPKGAAFPSGEVPACWGHPLTPSQPGLGPRGVASAGWAGLMRDSERQRQDGERQDGERELRAASGPHPSQLGLTPADSSRPRPRDILCRHALHLCPAVTGQRQGPLLGPPLATARLTQFPWEAPLDPVLPFPLPASSRRPSLGARTSACPAPDGTRTPVRRIQPGGSPADEVSEGEVALPAQGGMRCSGLSPGCWAHPVLALPCCGCVQKPAVTVARCQVSPVWPGDGMGALRPALGAQAAGSGCGPG